MEECLVFPWSVENVEEDVIVLKWMIQTGGRNSSFPCVRFRTPKLVQIEIKVQCVRPAGISEGCVVPISIHSACG